jgi:hypothetical protein
VNPGGVGITGERGLMETEKSLTQLFLLWSEQEQPPIVELLDINQRPVGALYLNKFRNKSQIVISETNNQERYYFYCDGVGIYFSFFKKLSR